MSMVTAMAGGSGGGGGAASSSSGTAGIGLVASADVFVKRSNIPFAGGGAFAARNLPTNDVLFPRKDTVVHVNSTAFETGQNGRLRNKRSLASTLSIPS